MLALEPYANDLNPEHVLVHLPGLNKDSVRQTPLFELYQAGKSFEKNLATLVREAARGEARPDEVENFLNRGEATLEGADAWLASLREQPRDEFTLRLEALGAEAVALALFRSDPRFANALPAEGTRLFEFLQKGLGISPEWRDFMGIAPELSLSGAATLVATWLMAVEFVSDLGTTPGTPALVPLTKLGSYKELCRGLAQRARAEDPETYKNVANQLQEALKPDQDHAATVLGSIDTFSFEEATTRRATLAALSAADWATASRYAIERTPEKCFWVKRSPGLERTWEILRSAADTGRAIADAAQGLKGCTSHEEALERYAERLASVDRLHRLFEQRAQALMHGLEDYDELLDVRMVLRTAYRSWADALTHSFTELCRAHGALPPPELRQRQVYDNVVHPLVEQGGRVAFFMVDALRFEMAQALGEELKRDRFSVSLQARLAELPTLTCIGMNALAPVEKNGRLRLAFDGDKLTGLRNQEYAIRLPADRIRAMKERSGSALDFELDDVSALSSAELKRRLGAKPGLIVVRSRELDDAGEAGLHLSTFEHTLSQLRSAISLLQQAGVERFVIASDHGFLLQDTNTTKAHAFGSNKRVADRRHVLADTPSGMADVLELPFAALEYDAEVQRYFVFRQDTAVWDVASKIAPFVHGGNSLQERVIPVLVLERQGRRGKTTTKYEILAVPEVGRLGRQRLRLSLRLQKETSAALSFHAPKAIALALRVPKRSDITLTVLDATPPARLTDGRVLLAPNGESTVVEFELEGEADEMLRVEVFHPDAVEDVTPKVVEGFFEVFRNRRLASVPPAASAPPTAPAAQTAAEPGPAGDWQSLVEDEGFRKVLVFIEQRRSMNEEELGQVLGSPRRVRAFSREFDALTARVPFTIEIRIVSGLKTYVRKE
jgi:hypothetical protein